MANSNSAVALTDDTRGRNIENISIETALKIKMLSKYILLHYKKDKMN